jgi:hypothetical protein
MIIYLPCKGIRSKLMCWYNLILIQTSIFTRINLWMIINYWLHQMSKQKVMILSDCHTDK